MKKVCLSMVVVPLVASMLLSDFNKSIATLPPIVPRQILFGNPERKNPRISPDGQYLTYLAPDEKNLMQVWIRTVGQNDDRMLTSEQKRGIQTYFWAYDSKHLIFQQDLNGNENWHLYAVDIKSKKVRDLTPFEGIQAQMIALEPNFPNEILVGINLKDPRKHDPYRINLKTGKAKLETETLANNTVDAVVDPQFNIRAIEATTPDGGSELLVKETPRKPWKTILKWRPDEEGKAISFSRDGKTLYITGNDNANATRLIAMNVATGKEAVLAQDPQYDVGETLINPTKREIEAVGFQKEKVEWQVLDQSIAPDFAAIAKVRRGQFRVVDRDLANKTWLVGYVTDDGPIYYYIYNRDSKKSTLLFSNQSKLEGLSLAQKKPISYKSRDGLTIHGYVSTPVGIPAKSLPTVLLVHGGPWERDTWGFNPMVQLLTNRGYAVLQVNFRGSSGYGKKFLNAGNREWGGKMHNDLIDGVKWIVEQGIANPEKIGIMGSSYGGYATLVGLTFTPDVFAAGVDVVGPSNLITFLKSIPPFLEPMKAFYSYRVGDLEKEPDFLKSRSPLFSADRIKAPLLIAQGANDVRVPQAESEQIVTAMREAKKPVEYILYEDEGHDFVLPGNRLHLIAKTEEFFGKYLGGRVEPIGDIPAHSGMSK